MELDLSGKKINEVISLRSRNPIPYYFPFATLSIGSPSARTVDLCESFKLSLLGLSSIKRGFSMRSHYLRGQVQQEEAIITALGDVKEDRA